MVAVSTDQTVQNLLRNFAELWGKRFYQLAAFELDTALHREPQNRAIHLLMGQTQLAINKHAEARTHCARAGEGSDETAIRAKILVDRIDKRDFPAVPRTAFGWLEGTEPIMPSNAPAAPVKSIAPPPRPLPQSPKPSSAIVAKPALTPTGMPKPSADPITVAKVEAQRGASAPITAESVKQAAAATGDAWHQWERDILLDVSRGHYDVALAKVEKALAQYQENVWLHEKKAELLDRLGKRRLSAETLLAAWEIIRKTGDRVEAEKMARRALVTGRDSPEFMSVAALALAAGSAASLAVEAMRHAAETYRKEGKAGALRHALEFLHAHLPGDQDVRAELDRVVAQSVVPAPRQASSAKNPRPSISPRISATPVQYPPRTSPKTYEERGFTDPAQEFREVKRRLEDANMQNVAGAMGAVGLIVAFFGCAIGAAGVAVIPILLMVGVHFMQKVAEEKAPKSPALVLFGIAKFLLIIAIIVGLAKPPIF